MFTSNESIYYLCLAQLPVFFTYMCTTYVCVVYWYMLIYTRVTSLYTCRGNLQKNAEKCTGSE